jgi:transketolase
MSDDRSRREDRVHRAHPETERDRIAIDTIRFLAVDMVEAGQSGHPGAPMGQAPWPTCSGPLPGTTRRGPTGRTATASCSPAATPRRCSTPCSTSRATTCRWRSSGVSASGARKPRATPRTSWPGGRDHHRPPRPGGRQRRRHGDRRGPSRGALQPRGLPALRPPDLGASASDGDLMEGVASEASSMAGHLRLGKLNVSTTTTGSPSTARPTSPSPRTWQALRGLRLARPGGRRRQRPGSSRPGASRRWRRPGGRACRWSARQIGYGAPTKQDTADAHGAPLGADEVRATKEALGWPLEPTFHVPEEAREAFAETCAKRGRGARRPGTSSWSATARSTRRRRPSSGGAWPASFRGVGASRSAGVLGRASRSPPARPPARR